VIAFNGNVQVQGNVTLAPGVYIISDGGLSMSGNNASLSGNGVTIILTSPTPSTDAGNINITGGSINLTAPTTGSTRGIVFWADARLPEENDNFAGGNASRIVGAVYLPSHDLKYAGNSGNVSPCMQLIANQVMITGTTTTNHNCANVAIEDPSISWTLVE